MRQRLVRLLLFTIFTATLCSQAFSQNCGQRDTIIFLPNSTASIPLEISDYFNDDLSDPMQSLCGIELGFVHQFVENFELSLTSPGGQTVSLLGPNSDDPLAFTPGTQWQITLVNCGSVAEPDSAFTAQWNNNQVENWVPFSLYDGSYYPFGGCLEDFNTGPVNGTWTFNITNDPSNNPGAITYLRLIFCDSRGVECCFAQAGELNNENILACVGEDTLLITPSILYEDAPPADTSEYSYAFLIGLDGIYQRLDSVLDLRTAAAGQYDICGLSYRTVQRDSLPLPDGMLTLDSIRSNLTGLEPWLCGELTPECLQVTIVAPPDTTRLNERICRGDSVLVGEQVFEDSGFYTLSLDNYAGCDSIVTLDLFVQEVQFTSLDTTICPGETITVGTSTYDTSGFYRDTIPSAELGCDSIVDLTLIVLAEQLTSLTPVICAGESFAVGDSTLTTSGSYQILLTSINGCDSLVSVDLLVLDPQAVITGSDLINCAMPESLLSSSSATPAGELTYRWLTPAEVDLAFTPNLLVTAGGDYILEVSQSVGGVVCTDRDTFNVGTNFATPTADAGPTERITCAVPLAQIGGSTSSTGAVYTYEWQPTGGSFSGPTNEAFATVDDAGTYQLIVLNTESFCADTSSVIVQDERILPTVNTGPAFDLNCLIFTDTLDGSASLGPDLTASWSGPCITDTPGPGLAVANCPGWYALEVTNNDNGCSNIDSVLVTENVDPALAVITAPDTLTCADDTVILDASPSSPNGGLDFIWSGPSGQSGTLAELPVTEIGEYEVIVVRQDNFCRDTTQVTVTQNLMLPLAAAGPDDTLNCYSASLILGNPTTSTGPAYTYQWFMDGNPITGAEGDTLVATATGTYLLEVTDTRNGCTASDATVITDDFLPPESVEAGQNQLLSCGGSAVQLQPDSTLFSRPVSWEWTSDCIEPQSDVWAITTECPGVYTLTVTNIGNGCQGSDTTAVTVSDNFSVAILPDTAYLSCTTGSVVLQNTGSIGSIFRWLRDGVLVSLPNNNPSVNVAGVYTLITSDLNMTCSDTATVEVLIDCTPQALIDPADTLTCIAQSVTLNGGNSIVEGPVSYQWSGPQNDCFVSTTTAATAEVVCPGEYQLIVTQTLFGLRDTITTNVVIDTIEPVVFASLNEQITCDSTFVTLIGEVNGAPEDYTYAWTPFFASEDTLSQALIYTTDQPGTYVFQAQSVINGCIGTDVVQVIVNNNLPIIAFGSSVFPCQADTFRLQAFVDPMDASYTYEWSGPGIQADADSLGVLINTIGTYTFTVTNNDTGCSATDMITVTEQTCVPCLELTPVDTLDCTTFTVDIVMEFCRDCVGCTLQWSDVNGELPGEEGLSLTVNTPGMYTLTATDLLGFSNSLTAEVLLLNDLPQVSLGPDRMLTCNSSSLILQNLEDNLSGDFTYRWESLTTGDLSENGPELIVNTADTYVLEVTNLLTNCSQTDTLVVNENLVPPIAEAGLDQQLTCQSNAVVLDGTGSTLSGVTYAWTGPSTGCLSGLATNTPVANCTGLYTLMVTSNTNGCTATDTVRVTQNEELPELTPLPDTVLNCTAESITLVATPPTMVNFTTRWCPLNELGEELSFACVPNMPDFMVDTPGQYQYTVVNDDTGCSNSFIVNVGIDTLPPPVEAGLTDTLFCNLGELTLNGTAPTAATYLWSSPTATQIDNPTTLQPTIYTPDWYYLEVQSTINGCTARDSVQIIEDDSQPTLTAGIDTLLNCFQPEIRLAATGMTLTGPPAWQWSGPGLIADTNSPTPLVGTAGQYIVTLTDTGNGCSVSDTVLVATDLAPPQAVVDDAGSLLLNCAQDTLELNGANSISSTGLGLSYQWRTTPAGNLFPDLTAPQVLTDRPGNYSLIVTDDGNGCRDTLAFSVGADFTEPDLTLAPATPLSCSDTTSLLIPTEPATPDGFQFSWTEVDGTVISTAFTATVSNSGLYFLELISEDNGCSTIASVVVGSSVDLPTVVINTNGVISCNQSTVLLDGNGSSVGSNYAYEWSSTDGTLLGNGQNLVDSTTVAGTYTLLITNTTTGCSRQDSVTILVQGAPITGLNIDLAPPACSGDLFGSISIDSVQGGSPPYQYSLDGQPFGNLSFFEDLLPGSYTLAVMDSEGCFWQETLMLTPSPPLELTITTFDNLPLGDSLQLGDSIQLVPIATRPVVAWKWDAPALLPGNAPYEPWVSPLESQFVVLTVTDENGCTASDTIYLNVAKLRQVYFPTAFSPNGDGNNEFFTIYAGQEVVEVERLRIFSRWGNMVFERDNFAPNDPTLGWDGTLWGEPLNPAVFVYYAQVRFVDGRVEVLTGDVALVK